MELYLTMSYKRAYVCHHLTLPALQSIEAAFSSIENLGWYDY
jgi:hypothetical protein